MTVQELLTEQTWCQGSSAKTADGVRTTVTSNSATKWCLLGAIFKCYQTPRARTEALGKVRSALGNWRASIPEYNDHHARTWPEIKTVIDKAGV